MNNVWYYSNDGKNQQGPISLEELHSLAGQGVVGNGTSVWTDSMAEWSTFGQCFPHLHPQPKDSGGNTEKWFYTTKQGDRIGPVSLEEMQVLIQSGRVFRSDLVWASHLTQWTPLDRILQFNELIRQLPPAVPSFAAGHGVQETIDSIKNLEMVSAIVWSIIAGIQMLIAIMLLLIPIYGPSFEAFSILIAGVWNIFAAISRFGLVKAIRGRRSSVVTAYQGVTQLIIIGIINLVLGAVIGALWVIIDFIIRDKVLKNKTIFDQ